jgi:hypothetical protein
MYIIIKKIKNESGVELPVVVLNGQSEVWEFDSESEADKIRDVFQRNSDSGHEYIVQKLKH